MTGSLLAFAALALVGGAAVVWFRAAMAVSLPENRTPFVAAWGGGALLGAFALTQGLGWLGGLAAGLALLVGTFLCGLVGISRQEAAADAVRVGAVVPDFSAPDDTGRIFESSELAGHPTLIKFFRGHW
jgi:hypothetical protein